MSSSFWTGIDDTTSGASLSTSGLIQQARRTIEDPKRRPRIWIDWGMVHTGGPHNELIEARACQRGREMRDLLTSVYGYKQPKELTAFEDPFGEHDEDAWGRRIEPALHGWFDR
jgi:hypothetical protein